jgi:hypothetical protein
MMCGFMQAREQGHCSAQGQQIEGAAENRVGSSLAPTLLVSPHPLELARQDSERLNCVTVKSLPVTA